MEKAYGNAEGLPQIGCLRVGEVGLGFLKSPKVANKKECAKNTHPCKELYGKTIGIKTVRNERGKQYPEAGQSRPI